jgi:hypothetical protein
MICHYVNFFVFADQVEVALPYLRYVVYIHTCNFTCIVDDFNLSVDYHPGAVADYSYSQPLPWLFIYRASWQEESLSTDYLTGTSLSFITVVNSL